MAVMDNTIITSDIPRIVSTIATSLNNIYLSCITYIIPSMAKHARYAVQHTLRMSMDSHRSAMPQVEARYIVDPINIRNTTHSD